MIGCYLEKYGGGLDDMYRQYNYHIGSPGNGDKFSFR